MRNTENGKSNEKRRGKDTGINTVDNKNKAMMSIKGQQGSEKLLTKLRK